MFPHLFSPIHIGGVQIRNRIVSTGHDTVMPENGLVTSALIAYQEARARGGTGLIIVQVAGIDDSARYTSHMLMADTDACIAGLAELAERCHRHGTKIFIQLFHPGRELMEGAGGLLLPALSSSATPSERFRSMPRAMSGDEVQHIIGCYGLAAGRMAKAGLDGVEILAGFGYLPGQFLDPRINRRKDDYGADGANRFRFLTDVIASVRDHTPPQFVTGVRLSSSDQDDEGLSAEEVLETISVVAPSVDYLHVVSGTSATLGGAVHIAPPMAYPNGYLAPFAARVKQLTDKPVIVTGRINQPQIAESIISEGRADLCGMTRALISDPDMPTKALTGRLEEIRACIGCNQACIGHFHKGAPVSCIQLPETGRELRFGTMSPAPTRMKILIAGGGPAGMKAALTLAARGHDVHLHESEARLGGAIRLAQRLPRRAEFGGLITNLLGELGRANVQILTHARVDSQSVQALAPEAVVIACGGRPYHPPCERLGSMPILHAESALQTPETVGAAVVIYDLRSDWVGVGLAELMATRGCRVTLALPGTHAGEALPFYVRDEIIGRLHRLGVEIKPYLRLVGVDDDTVYFRHTASQQLVEIGSINTLVNATGREADDSLALGLSQTGIPIRMIGDALAARTAEEAIYEGLIAGWEL